MGDSRQIDAKDPYTKGHSSRVSRYAQKTAAQLGWDTERIKDLEYAALLHDIGSNMLKDRILVRMADDVAGFDDKEEDPKNEI